MPTAAIPAVECGEHLIDLRLSPALRFACRSDRPAMLRAGVADRLVNAQTLLPLGLRLLIYDCRGTSVDVTLCTVTGEELWLGGWVGEPSAEKLSLESVHYRDTLSLALRRSGLVNHAPMWWRWSYGDRVWALLTGAPHARYA